MMKSSAQPWDQIFVKGYGFLSFPKNMGKNIGKIIIKTWVVNTVKKLLDHTKHSSADAFTTTSKRTIQNNSRSNWWFDWW